MSTRLADQTLRSSGPTQVGLRWVHLCNGLDPERDGGMVPSILGLTGSLASSHEGVGIVTPTPSNLGTSRVPSTLRLIGPEPDLSRFVRTADVVHLHGLWQAHTRKGAQAARRYRVPYLVAAHGMAEPWALRHKALKKKLYTALVEGKNLRLAGCLHALSKPEVGHLRALAPHAPVALVPNGVNLEPFEDLPDRSVLEAVYPQLAGRRLILFFGRLHVKKGLDLLAESFSAVASDHPDAHLVLAGRDDGALGPFRQRLEAHRLSDRVTVLGHVAGETARQVWGAADAFVLPSYSEGFSMAVLEALAARKPVLASTACHFPELQEAGGALIQPPSVEGITLGLRTLLELSPSERLAMADRGRALVESRFTWTRQAERLAEVYRWLGSGGPPPEAVEEAEAAAHLT
ncbi:MAG TPA: glycosyltransferase [Isosphaeraceae bacterium]|nr:glycosyltransferase [Isosphaeraceae bacterium]